MSAFDAEDGLDQLLGSMNGQVAQQLSMLHNAIDQKSRELKADRERNEERERQRSAADEREREAQARHLEAQRAALYEWETANRSRLNDGFEYVLDQTILSGRANELDDRHLARAWVVGEQLQGNDPGYAVKLTRAQSLMQEEWNRRHPDTHIASVANQSINHVVITYAERNANLDRTVDAFRKANLPLDLVLANDTETFRKEHADGFHVETRMNGGWDGWDETRIQDAVLQDAYANIDGDIDDAIAFLRETDLDEAAPADRLAGGIEPAETSEVERGELRDAAPVSLAATPVREVAEVDGDPEKEEGLFDLDSEELGGDDAFGVFDVASESDLAAKDQDMIPASATLDAHDLEHRMMASQRG